MEVGRGTISTPRSATSRASAVETVGNDTFWRHLRELRTALVQAGEDTWDTRLRAELRGTTHRRGHAPGLLGCLEELRASPAAVRLGLVERVDALLAVVRDGP